MNIGERVIIKHQRDMGVCFVVNSHDPTDMTRIGGQPVGYYVRIDCDTKRNLGYHESSLEVVEG